MGIYEVLYPGTAKAIRLWQAIFPLIALFTVNQVLIINVFRVYDRWPHFDIVMHIIGGALVMRAIIRLWQNDTVRAIMLSTILWLWELYEAFWYHRPLGTLDTITDIQVSTIGAGILFLILYVKEKTNKKKT